MTVALGIIVWASLPCSGRHELARVMSDRTDLIDDYNWIPFLGTVSKFVEDYQDFDHRGFPNMGHGGGGPHGGGSHGGGCHGCNFRRLGDSSRSGATHPFNSGGVSRGCGVSKFVKDYQDFDHRGFPNMGHGGGGPHGGASRGGGRHGGNFRRSGDSSRSGAQSSFK
ncbi:hypothetical protein Tco_0844186 [Tanacetum coccineum]